MKIAIIGAGISGLTLGNLIFSNKNQEIEFQIFEKRKKDHKDSGGIQLSPNATNILNIIGFKKLDYANFHLPKSINFLDLLSGEKIFDLNILDISSRDKPYICIKRSVLIDFLLNRLQKDIVNFNKEVINIKNIDNYKKIIFSDGTSYLSDLIISADGVFSKIRDKEFNRDQLSFSGSVAFRTDYIKSSEIFELQKENISVFMGPSSHSVLYPLNKEKDFNFVSIISKKSLKVDKEDWTKNINNFNDLFYEKMKNWNNNLRNIIKNKKISCWPIFKVKTIDSRIQNNIILIGDAAHAIVPYHAQGAAQSIEDAYLLYKHLKKNNLYLNIQNFQKIRKKRILEVEKRSNVNQFIFHLSNNYLKFLRKNILKFLLKNRVFVKIYFNKLFNHKP
tara:strand:- start:1409 stop:2581 length:1173 start_codon:yes stop_codon:yes gene_type:complete